MVTSRHFHDGAGRRKMVPRGVQVARGTKIAVWIASIAVVIVLVALRFLYLPHRKQVQLTGVVTAQNGDARARIPISDVGVTVSGDGIIATVKSDSSGLFTVQLPASVRKGEAVTVQLRHPEYQPLDMHEFVSDKLYVFAMQPLAGGLPNPPNSPEATISNLRVRYSIKGMTVVNIGSAAKAFQVVNTGNVPCNGHSPCSPDGKWKAATGSVFLDAGAGNEFRNARASCIAGPCPFTKIEKDDFTQSGQTIRATARNWSDTATFLLEAEVFHPMVSENVHESHPITFGRALNFTLPAAAEGVCIEADMAGQTIIYPLGPALYLSWANCDATVNKDQTKVYRCELKNGYQFPDRSGQQ